MFPTIQRETLNIFNSDLREVRTRVTVVYIQKVGQGAMEEIDKEWAWGI